MTWPAPTRGPAPGSAPTAPRRIGARRSISSASTAPAHSVAGAREWMDYAVYAKRIGLPNEAQTVIVDGRTAKVILPADAEADQMLRDAKAAIAADKPLATQEKLAAAAPKGDLASQTGDAYLGAGNLAKAIEMYKLAVSKGHIDRYPVNFL